MHWLVANWDGLLSVNCLEGCEGRNLLFRCNIIILEMVKQTMLGIRIELCSTTE